MKSFLASVLFLSMSAFAVEGEYLGEQKCEKSKSCSGFVYKIEKIDGQCVKVFSDLEQSEVIKETCVLTNAEAPSMQQQATPEGAKKFKKALGGEYKAFFGYSNYDQGGLDLEVTLTSHYFVAVDEQVECLRSIKTKEMAMIFPSLVGIGAYIALNPISFLQGSAAGEYYKRTGSICWSK